MSSPLQMSRINKSSFNYYTIIFTSFVFFLILSFYTFFLSIFGYCVFDLDGKNEKSKGSNIDAFVGTFVFFLSWLAIVLLLYIYLDRNNLFHL